MVRLPLFPLNTVLFPGMPIYLHIFEDRYKLMIGRCLEAREPFGIVLLKSGSEVEGFGAEAEPYTTGCSAVITQVQPVGDGRLNLVAVGHERFRVLSHHHDEPYLTGDVEYLPFASPGGDSLRPQAQRLRGWLERYLQVLERVENVSFDREQMPEDPISLTYLAAYIVRLPSEEKQALLLEDNALELVRTLRTIYRRETMFLEIMATPHQPTEPTQGPFTLN
jgi:Lon protease-like protein